MSLACLDSPAAGTLKRQIVEKEDISLYSLSQLKLLSFGSRARVKPAYSAISLANILSTDYFQIYAYVHYKGIR